jgi:DNA-binding CsgD family transcriptional regulator
MPHSCSHSFASRQRGDIAASPTGDLTPREAEMAAWLARGKTNWEISVICRVSARTVEKHVEHILRKLNVENRTAAVVALIERRLLA